PYQSILDGDGNSGYVFITNDMKTANKVKINIFDLDMDDVYVDEGLESSKYLIVSGSAYLNDGSRIKIDKADP
ncbi:MAG: efflux RND transporter periplasmic adaptor subunit, partial [Ignavibacteria bacterium]